MLTKLGKYLIKRELGKGGLGVIYEGFDPFIQRSVAIKTVQKSLLKQPDAQEVLSRFRREALAAGQLTHPNVAAVYDYGEEGDAAYIVTEHVVGIGLKDYFDMAKRFQVREITDIMSQLLDALEYAHGCGVIHGDVKPSNIIVAKGGKVKITEFGITKIESPGSAQADAMTDAACYMPPEQFTKVAVDNRSDIYSVGAILYQLLAGERPFTGGSVTEIMQKVLNQTPVPLSKLNPDLPKALQSVVDKAIAKQSEGRFQTVTEFLKALKLAAGMPATQTATADAVLQTPATVQNLQKSSAGASAVANFSAADFDARLQESQREANRKAGIVDSDAQTESSWNINLEFDRLGSLPGNEVKTETKTPVPVVLPSAELGGSSLLAGLALEAKEKLSSKQSATQEIQAKAMRVDDALNKIAKFLNPFIKHVNEVEPTINRTYSYDARIIYSNLKWQGATVDHRKQSMSDTALMDFVTFQVNLCAPHPIIVKRPWGQLDTLKKELLHLKLRMIDDMGASGKTPKQDWFEVQLAPDFLVQMRFQGNHNVNNIDVVCRNVESFETASYKLQPEDVTPAFLDALGLFLLGRSAKLPAQLRRV